MNAVEVIKKKRDGYELTETEIKNFIRGFTEGAITDYQMSAWLMAVYLKGLNENETRCLTETYIDSGIRVDLSGIGKPKIDKHSTGGVGDKTSLILAPLVSCFDVVVPMISGRGLGYTGGTLDKLEAIPGFRVNLSVDEFVKNLEMINVCMIGQTDALTPADRKIYALRDVTGTVENISLITASIVSKKIAEGAEGVVYDIKYGNGTNFPEHKVVQLARSLIKTSNDFGQKALAVVTDMNSPLGYAVGNLLEVWECVEIMNPDLPVRQLSMDLLEVTLFLAGAMLYLSGKSSDIEEGIKMAGDKLINGEAYRKFCKMIELQGGDPDFLRDIDNSRLSKYSKKLCSESDGYLLKADALAFGKAAVELGCGRKKADDPIDYGAGIMLRKKPGDELKKGDVICEIYGVSEDGIDKAFEILSDGIRVGEESFKRNSKILKIIDN